MPLCTSSSHPLGRELTLGSSDMAQPTPDIVRIDSSPLPHIEHALFNMPFDHWDSLLTWLTHQPPTHVVAHPIVLPSTTDSPVSSINPLIYYPSTHDLPCSAVWLYSHCWFPFLMYDFLDPCSTKGNQITCTRAVSWSYGGQVSWWVSITGEPVSWSCEEWIDCMRGAWTCNGKLASRWVTGGGGVSELVKPSETWSWVGLPSVEWN